jgi:hypothetical protein
VIPAGLAALALGVYGAVLTSYSVWLARRQTQCRLVVQLGFAPASHLALSVLNLGSRTVSVELVGLALADRTPLTVPVASQRMRLPLVLADGEHGVVLFGCRAVARALLAARRYGRLDLVGFSITATGRWVWSEPLSIDVGPWLSSTP